MSLVKDIADYLEDSSIGTVGTDVFAGELPDQPDDVIGSFEYSGRPPDVLAGIDRPGLQIRGRGTSYETVRGKMKSVEDLLRQIGDEFNKTLCDGVEINDTFYLRIQPVGGVLPLGRDGKERVEMTQNYQIDIRR